MITQVVAVGLKNEIGAGNQLPWHLPKDLKHFKALTENHPVIMGRKTYESIGKPLPNRTNIIVSSKKDWFEEGVLIVGSIKEAVKFATKIHDNVFIIGGGEIFRQTLDITDKIELTRVHAEVQADVFFPELNSKIWVQTWEECHTKDQKHPYDFCFQTWERLKKPV